MNLNSAQLPQHAIQVTMEFISFATHSECHCRVIAHFCVESTKKVVPDGMLIFDSTV